MAGLADRYVLVCLRCNFHVCLSLSCHGLWTWTFHQTCCGGDRAKPQFLLCFPDCCYLHSLFFLFYFSFPYSPAMTRLLLTVDTTWKNTSFRSFRLYRWNPRATYRKWNRFLRYFSIYLGLKEVELGHWNRFWPVFQFSSHSFFVKEDLACICMWRCIFAVCHHLPNAGCGTLSRALCVPNWCGHLLVRWIKIHCGGMKLVTVYSRGTHTNTHNMQYVVHN